MSEELGDFCVVGERNWGPPKEVVFYSSYTYEQSSDWLEGNNFLLGIDHKNIRIEENYEHKTFFLKGGRRMKLQLFTTNGKELHYSDVSKIETTDDTMTIYRMNSRIVELKKSKVVKLVSYV